MSLIIPANTLASGGFSVDNSLRSNPGSSPRLHINALGTATDIDKWTFSCWFKRSTLSSSQYLLYAYTSGQEAAILLNSDNKLDWYNYPGGGAGQIITNRLFRDVSAFYHLVCSYDGDNGTAGNRMRIYINGVEETSFATDTNPSSGEDQVINSNVAHNIGLKYSDAIQNNFSGYLSEVCLIDGQQLDPTSFGEFDEDSGIWKPIDVSGLTFGNNGFYQTYSNSGALGEDFSGNNKDFTSTNLTAIDQSTDTPTNNFCTLNPLIGSNNITLSEGNLYASSGAASWSSESSTFSLSQGKWYLEDYVVGYNHNVLGVQYSENATNRVAAYPFEIAGGYGFKFYNGSKTSQSADSASYGNAVSNGQTVGMALDLDNHKIYWSINGTWQNSGDPTSGATGTGSAFDLPTGKDYVIVNALNNQSGGAISSFNFGSPPHSISSGNSDGNGYGNFEYAVPANYYSLNTKNLAEYG